MRWFRSALATASAAAAVSLTAVPLTTFSSPEVEAEACRTAADLRRRCLSSMAVRREQFGAPGISGCVSVRGQRLLSAGVGFADVENLIPCTGRTVMRIASISKCFASVLAAKLVETEKLDLDKPLGNYLTQPDMKKFANITSRQLLSHTSGVRHYRAANPKEVKNELANQEYYLTKNFATVTDSLSLFANDPLVFEPGTKMLYSTMGYTLLSAVLESAAGGRPLASQFRALFAQLGVSSGTSLEQHDRITEGRGRQYQRGAGGRLVNAAYVDNSYKWAGGGLVSCAEDCVTLGETLLRCAEGRDSLLKPSTVHQLWTPVKGTKVAWGLPTPGSYGLGWGVAEYRGFRIVLHTGGSIGGTCVLLLVPDIGAVICLIANLESASVTGLSLAMLDAVLDFLRDSEGTADAV